MEAPAWRHQRGGACLSSFVRRFACHTTGPYIISGKALAEVGFERYISVSLGLMKEL